MKTNVIIFILSVFLFVSCKRDRQSSIPYVPVDITIYLSDPQYFNLNFVGGWGYLNGGSRGIVVYRITQDGFVAFDRHCTYDVANPCGQVSVDTNSFFLTDTCCNSSFLVSDGSVYRAPATLPLQYYRTTYYENYVRIYN